MRNSGVALLLALLVTTVMTGCGSRASGPAAPSPAVHPKTAAVVSAAKGHRLAIIAHRGASKEMPENTVRAFVRAAELPTDAFELDLHTTRDGHIVVMHDPTVDRTTDGKGRVADLDLATLRRLNAGRRGQFAQIPTLDEALDSVTDRTTAVMELKERRKEIVAQVVARIRQRHLERSVVLESFYPELLAEGKRLAPEIKTLYLYDGSTLAPLKANEACADYLGLSIGSYRKLSGQVDKPVWVWTVNDEKTLTALAATADPNLAGIITDDPALALRVLEESGRGTAPVSHTGV